MQDIMQLCDTVRETAFAIHKYHKHGHLEKVYENALAQRLRKLGLDVKQQHPLTVYDEDGTVIGEYFADLYVDNRLITELKAVKALADEHIAQILGYLRASRIQHGLLMNLGAPKFEIRKYALSQPNDERPGGKLASLLFSMSSIRGLRAAIRRTTDLFMRVNTQEAEIVATVIFAHRELAHKSEEPPTGMDVLRAVMDWRKRRRPPLEQQEVALHIRNLAALSWLKVKASDDLPLPADELDAV